MSRKLPHQRTIFVKLIKAPIGLLADQRGTVAVMMGLLIPVLVGGMGLGFEVTNWYLTSRAMQNAADAAAIAAASNGSSNYDIEAKAVAAKYGFVDGSNNVTVTASDAATCPPGATLGGVSIVPPCYSVTISSVVPLYLSQVVGYQGDTTLKKGGHAKILSSTAVSNLTTIKQPICLLGLNQTGAAITTNGAPNSNFSGCTVMSNSDSYCNGSNLNAYYGLAAGTNTACGDIQRSNVPTVNDPYLYMADNIPKNPCSGSYPQETGNGKNKTLPAGNLWSGDKQISTTLTGAKSGLSYTGAVFCGDVQLQDDVNLKTPDSTSGAVIVIENGLLDLNGHTLKTADGSAVTFVFSGTNGGTYQHYPTDNSPGKGGLFDIRGTGSSGAFAGMAIYQDPSLTTGIDFSYKGNNPTWKISGGVYAPNANLTISGDVSQASDGADCFVMVAGTVLINGTSNIYQQTPNGSGCELQGLDVPHATILGRGTLVY